MSDSDPQDVADLEPTVEDRIENIEDQLSVAPNTAEAAVDRTPLGASRVVLDEEDAEQVAEDDGVDEFDAKLLVDGSPDPDDGVDVGDEPDDFDNDPFDDDEDEFDDDPDA
jgi:hypothetical protein